MEYGIPFFARSNAQANQAVVDWWSPVHLMFGIASGVWGMNPWFFLAGTVLYEWWEHIQEYPKGSAFFGTGESEWRANLVMDIGMSSIGYALGSWVNALGTPRSEIGAEAAPFGT